MDEPNGAEAWGNIPADGISPIHRPTSAPPVMELTQQLNGTDLAHQGFPGMDPAYFGVVSDGSDPRDPSVSGFFADSSKLGYLSGPVAQDDFMTGTHSSEQRSQNGASESFGASTSGHPQYHQHMMPTAHSHMSHYAMHQGAPQAMSMAPGGVAYFGMPNPGMSAHMAGYHGNMNGPMAQAYGYQGYMAGASANGTSQMPPEMMYRQGAVPAGYFGYSHFQPSDSHMYGYGGPMQQAGAPQGRAHSVGGEDAAKQVPFVLHGMPRAGYGGYSPNMGLSASPPSEGPSWNKSSPRGKRTAFKGQKPNSEVSLSSSTEDLLSLAGKPHLIKDLGPSGSLEFSGSLAELPLMNSPSPGPHSPRSPQHARKHIKVQQRNNSNGGGGYKATESGNRLQSADLALNGAGRGAQNGATGSHPMPIGWSGVQHANVDDMSGLLAGVHLGAPSAPMPVSALAMNSGMAHPEFVMGSGSPIMARMHHPAAANGNAAPGSHTNGGAQICHYYTMGMCGKGDKCRYVHVEESGSGRRTPRAPAVSPVSFGAETPNAALASGAMHMQGVPHAQASGANHLGAHASMMLAPGQSSVVGSLVAMPTSAIGQAPLIASPMDSLLVGGANASGTASNTGSGASASSAASANAQNAQNAQVLASMRYSNATLEECVGQIFQMCKDQYGCRFLQKKLDEDKTSMTCDIIFGEILPEVVDLMSDPFGNYLCQKLIEKCTPTQRLAIVRGVSGSLVQISKNMHGTRAVQKTIEQLGSSEEVRFIREALKGSVVALIQDLNGNHVIQKCIHRLEPNDNQFIYDAVAHHCVQVATHRHGCCVMQRCIDHSSNQQKMQLIEEIKNNALSLVQDQFGNYVVQYVLDLGMESVCESLATNLLGHLYYLSTQKFSSNVVEKCLKVGNAATVQMMSRELAEFQTDPAHPVFPQTPHEDPLICLLQHPFGNYVVQTALQVAQVKAPTEWHLIATRIRPLIPTLRSNTYVKRVQGLLLQTSAKQAAEAGTLALEGHGALAAAALGSSPPNSTPTSGTTSPSLLAGSHANAIAANPMETAETIQASTHHLISSDRHHQQHHHHQHQNQHQTHNGHHQHQSHNSHHHSSRNNRSQNGHARHTSNSGNKEQHARGAYEQRRH
jgi:hypothetical protein